MAAGLHNAVALGHSWAEAMEGAGAGLLYYVTPQWDYLLRGSTWIDGATQIFFAYRCRKK